MTHPISCNCGKLKGTLELNDGLNRAICYCRDCQAFARFLGHEAQVLDSQGGTDIVQTIAKSLRFTDGIEQLACMRLSEKGLLRWYASCCNTPIGNTSANYQLSVVGLVHSCLGSTHRPLDATFGPVRACVYTESALGAPKPKAFGLASTMLRIVPRLLKARLDGSYKHTPFFIPGTSTPIVQPRVLSVEERAGVTGTA
nr:DUF6151 family protein [uncultured Pseudomonas sp.]